MLADQRRRPASALPPRSSSTSAYAAGPAATALLRGRPSSSIPRCASPISATDLCRDGSTQHRRASGPQSRRPLARHEEALLYASPSQSQYRRAPPHPTPMTDSTPAPPEVQWYLLPPQQRELCQRLGDYLACFPPREAKAFVVALAQYIESKHLLELYGGVPKDGQQLQAVRESLEAARPAMKAGEEELRAEQERREAKRAAFNAAHTAPTHRRFSPTRTNRNPRGSGAVGSTTTAATAAPGKRGNPKASAAAATPTGTGAQQRQSSKAAAKPWRQLPKRAATRRVRQPSGRISDLDSDEDWGARYGVTADHGAAYLHPHPHHNPHPYQQPQEQQQHAQDAAPPATVAAATAEEEATPPRRFSATTVSPVPPSSDGSHCSVLPSRNEAADAAPFCVMQAKEPASSVAVAPMSVPAASRSDEEVAEQAASPLKAEEAKTTPMSSPRRVHFPEDDPISAAPPDPASPPTTSPPAEGEATEVGESAHGRTEAQPEVAEASAPAEQTPEAPAEEQVVAAAPAEPSAAAVGTGETEGEAPAGSGSDWSGDSFKLPWE